MKKNNNRPQFIFGMALLVILAVLMVQHFHIRDFNIVKPEVLYISGQPKGMDYTRLLYKYHIGTIVNLRPSAEHRDQNWYTEEISWVKQNGVTYIELPIDKNDYLPDQAAQNKFIDIMAEPKNLPVLLHGSGNTERAAMLTAVWMIKSKNFTVPQTQAEIENILKRPVTPAEKEFISSLAK